LIALIVDSLPASIGYIMYGKITISLRGTTGRVKGRLDLSEKLS
jgi:hypothetical protein